MAAAKEGTATESSSNGSSSSEKLTPVTNKKLYIALYKPAGVLCTFFDDAPRAQSKQVPKRTTLLDMGLPTHTLEQQHEKQHENLHACGRLDKDTEGLLLLTNDGHFTQRCMDPSSKVAKTYMAHVKGYPDSTTLHTMRTCRLLILGRLTQPPASVCTITPAPILRDAPSWGDTWLEIVLHEGKNRQVRRICKSVGHPVSRLVRVRIGNLCLPRDLQPGEWKFIQPESVF